MNSVFFDVPSRIASYSKLKKARLEVIKDIISIVETWTSTDCQYALLQQLSLLKKSIQSHDFKFSSKDITAIPQGRFFSETVTNAIILLHNCQSSITTKLATTKLKQTQAVPSLGEKKLPDVFVVRNYAAELVGNHPTSSFSLDSVLVSPKEVSFFETAPTLPSLQAALIEAATFVPCPLVKDLQPVWDIPLQLKPQAAPSLQHIPETALPEGTDPAQPTLRAAILEGLYEVIDDPLEPIEPVHKQQVTFRRSTPLNQHRPPYNTAPKPPSVRKYRFPRLISVCSSPELLKPCDAPTMPFKPAIFLAYETRVHTLPTGPETSTLGRNFLQHTRAPMSSTCYFMDKEGSLPISCRDLGFNCSTMNRSSWEQAFVPTHITGGEMWEIYLSRKNLVGHQSRLTSVQLSYI